MQIASEIYTYGFKKRKLDKIMSKIKKMKKVSGLYLIVMPLFNDGIMEIYEYRQMLQPYYRSRWDDIIVLGITGSIAEAKLIVLKIVQDLYDAHLDFNVGEYFKVQG